LLTSVFAVAATAPEPAVLGGVGRSVPKVRILALQQRCLTRPRRTTPPAPEARPLIPSLTTARSRWATRDWVCSIGRRSPRGRVLPPTVRWASAPRDSTIGAARPSDDWRNRADGNATTVNGATHRSRVQRGPVRRPSVRGGSVGPGLCSTRLTARRWGLRAAPTTSGTRGEAAAAAAVAVARPVSPRAARWPGVQRSIPGAMGRPFRWLL